MRLRIVLMVATLPLLAACAETPLEESVAGKSGAERERAVYAACIQHSNITSGMRSRRLRTLCSVMRDANLREDG